MFITHPGTNQDISSYPPSAAYMCQRIGWALFQIMACHLFKLQWNFNQNTKFFIHENAFEKIVSEMEAILSRGRWVNIFIEGCDISMFILIIVKNGCSHSIYDFHTLTHLCCDKMAVVLHMIFWNAFLEQTLRLIFLCELHWNSFKLECFSIGLNNSMVPV